MADKPLKKTKLKGKSILDLDDDAGPALPPGFPVLPDAAPQMKIDVVVNRDHKVWVLHDRPFPDYLEWIEFDAETGAMTFVSAGGRMQELGMTIHPPMDKFVREATQACVMMIRDKQVRDMGLVPLMVQNHALIKGGSLGSR